MQNSKSREQRRGWMSVAKVLPALLALSQLASARECLRYEVSAILQGPFCPGWGNDPVYARGMNNLDPPWVCGFYTECTAGFDKAYVWTGSGAIQPLNFAGNPGGEIVSSYAYDVTDTGLVVGAYSTASGPWKGFVYDVKNGTWLELTSPHPQGACVPRAANNAGMVVGSRTTASGESNAFIYHNGVYTDLGIMNGPKSEARDLSEDGTIAGWTGTALSANDCRAFILKNGKINILEPLPGGVNSAALQINEVDQACLWGRVQTPQGLAARAAIWTDGIFTVLQPLNSYRHSIGEAISNNGVVIGACTVLPNYFNAQVATLWLENVAIDINSLITDKSNVHLASANAINDDGEILCQATDPQGNVTIMLTPISSVVGDVTGDCLVNVSDLLLVINEWGNANSVADINRDGIVNVVDLLLVIENWTY